MFTAAEKKPFPPFFLPWPPWQNMSNHHDKQLTPMESWDQDGFFSLGLGYHQIKIIELEFSQCCGTQIRVDTWTGSYCKYWPTSRCFLVVAVSMTFYLLWRVGDLTGGGSMVVAVGNIDRWQVTGDRWVATCNACYVTRDTWYETCNTFFF